MKSCILAVLAATLASVVLCRQINPILFKYNEMKFMEEEAEDKAKRSKEDIMFGNQQNKATNTVMKSSRPAKRDIENDLPPVPSDVPNDLDRTMNMNTEEDEGDIPYEPIPMPVVYEFEYGGVYPEVYDKPVYRANRIKRTSSNGRKIDASRAKRGASISPQELIALLSSLEEEERQKQYGEPRYSRYHSKDYSPLSEENEVEPAEQDDIEGTWMESPVFLNQNHHVQPRFFAPYRQFVPGDQREKKRYGKQDIDYLRAITDFEGVGRGKDHRGPLYTKY